MRKGNLKLNSGGFVRFVVNAPVSGTYRLRVRHSSAWSAASTRSIILDGVRTGAVTFAPTGAWGSWRTTDVALPLSAGAHSAQLLFATTDAGALNIDNALFELVAAGAVTAPTTAPIAPTTTIATAPVPSGPSAAAEPALCAGGGSQTLVRNILENKKYWLQSTAASGIPGMEETYSVLLSPLEMAVNCTDIAMMDDMSFIVLGSVSGLSGSSSGRVWLYNGAEARLVSAAWIQVLARLIDGISAVPASQRTQNMNAVTQTFVPVVASHLKRWVVDTTFYGLSGCPYIWANGHTAYLALLRTKTLGGAKSFCNAMINTDYLIMAGAAEFLIASRNDPGLVNLGSLGISQQTLATYVGTSADLVRSRLVPTPLNKPNGTAAQGYDIDPGVFSDFAEETEWSGYTGLTFPTLPSGAVVVAPFSSPKAGWDTGHIRAFAQAINSLRRARSSAGSSFPTDAEMVGLSNQVAYGVLIGGNTQWPQFANYFSGWNGWYRVNYYGRAGFGYGPSDLGNSSYMEGTLGLWARWNPDLSAINARIGAILQSTDPQTAAWREATYTKNWNNFVRSGTPNLYRDSSPFLLQHVASSLGASW